MAEGPLAPVGIENSVSTPEAVIRPIRLAASSVNQRFPSGPLVIPNGPVGAGSGNSVIAPAVVMRPIWFASNSVNQRLASGPAVMKRGELDAVGMGKRLTSPAGVIRPIRL